jgi:hypothetical protein
MRHVGPEERLNAYLEALEIRGQRRDVVRVDEPSFAADASHDGGDVADLPGLDTKWSNRSSSAWLTSAIVPAGFSRPLIAL